MDENQAEFRRIFLAWASSLGVTKRQLYKYAQDRGKTKNWMESRQRGIVTVTHEDLDWLRQASAADTERSIDLPYYDCYDCEERLIGKPYFTMIPAKGEDPGAFLCPACFKGLEAKGFVPDNNE